jgi:hypothetical protein
MAESPQTQPLKAIPSASVNGKEITFDVSKSTGSITQYGFQLEESTPTQSPVVYLPGSSHKGADFVSIKATVQKSGTYTFRLTVYDTSGQDHTNFNVDVK